MLFKKFTIQNIGMVLVGFKDGRLSEGLETMLALVRTNVVVRFFVSDNVR